MSDNIETEWFKKNRCHTDKNYTTTAYGVTSYNDTKINQDINNIIINKLDSEKANIENIAMDVISEYKSKLTTYINDTIYKELTDGLDTYLKNEITGEKITEKIVKENVKNFQTLLDGKPDKDFKYNYKGLLKLGDICKAATNEGGSTLIHKKTHTRKSNKKKRERKTKRIRGGFTASKCINVEAICNTVTSLISNKGALFMIEINNQMEKDDKDIIKLKEKLEVVCREKTNEILDQIAKQAIDYGALDEILKYLIAEITELVKSNIGNSKHLLCKDNNT